MLRRIIETDCPTPMTGPEADFTLLTYRDRDNGTYVIYTNKVTDKTGLVDGKEMVNILTKVIAHDAEFLAKRVCPVCFGLICICEQGDLF